MLSSNFSTVPNQKTLNIIECFNAVVDPRHRRIQTSVLRCAVNCNIDEFISKFDLVVRKNELRKFKT